MIEQFDADWLSLREPADHRARAASDLSGLAQYCPRHRVTRVLDLGSGTGSNLHYLAARLPAHEQEWVLFDHDPELLNRAERRVQATQWAGPAITVQYQQGDLAQFQTYPAAIDVITASALLDLVSAAWIDGLVDYARQQNAAVLLALSYDGRIAFTPQDPDDSHVGAWVNQHQRGPKDMGAALGPEAWLRASEAFARAGYTVKTPATDWQLDHRDTALQRATIAGWHAAAHEVMPSEAERLSRWQQRRIDALGHSTLSVGHRDVLALPCRD